MHQCYQTVQEMYEKILYKDMTSMYPWAMQACRYPIKKFQICRFDDPDFPLISLNTLFGLQKCDVIPPNNLYHPVLPVRDKASGKLLFTYHRYMDACRASESCGERISSDKGVQAASFSTDHQFSVHQLHPNIFRSQEQS